MAGCVCLLSQILAYCGIALLANITAATALNGKLVWKHRGCVLMEPKHQIVRRYRIGAVEHDPSETISCGLTCSADGRHVAHLCSGSSYQVHSGPLLTRRQCEAVYGNRPGDHCSDACNVHRQSFQVVCHKVLVRGGHVDRAENSSTRFAEQLKCVYHPVHLAKEPLVDWMSPCGYDQEVNENRTLPHAFAHGQLVVFILPKLQQRQKLTRCTCLDGKWLKSQAPGLKAVAKPCRAILDKTGAASSKWRPIRVETPTICP